MLLYDAHIAGSEQKVDDCPQTELKKLEPAFKAAGIIDPKPRIQVKPPAPTKLTGIEDDVAFCRRTAGAIDELLNEASTIATNIAIGAVYAKAHAWLARNSKTDTARIGWRRAFEEAYFPHKRRQAEDLICIHTVFAGTAVPANFPHNLRSQRLLARQRASNLKWGTQKESLNAEGFITYCRSRTGENHPRAKGRQQMKRNDGATI